MLDERAVQFLSLYAAGATLERLGREVLGVNGSYMQVCGVAFRYRNRLLQSIGIDSSLPQKVTRQMVREMLYHSREEELSAAETLQARQFAETVRYLQEQVGLPRHPVSAPAQRPQGELTKILTLSDLHVPFHNVELLTSAIREHRDADVVVLLGDFLDMYSASRFTKERVLDPIDEIREAAAILELLASTFPRVVVLEGNHDSRAVRWLHTTRPELGALLLHPFEYIRYVWNGGLQHRYSNVEFPQAQVHTSGPMTPVTARHFTVIGDALFGHFERSLKGPARTAYQLALEWLPVWEGLLFPQGAVRVLVQGHVHRLSKVQWSRYTLFECGCVADIMTYTVQDPRYHPPQMGYVVLYQRDGVTDVNMSHYYVFDRFAQVNRCNGQSSAE